LTLLPKNQNTLFLQEVIQTPFNQVFDTSWLDHKELILTTPAAQGNIPFIQGETYCSGFRQAAGCRSW